MRYLAIVENGLPSDNITFEAFDFDSAYKILKHRIKRGSMFNTIKLVELNTMVSRKYYIEK